MPVIQDFRIVDDFYLWESLQGINNARTIEQFRIVDNYYLYLQNLVVVASIFPPATTLLTFRVPLTAAQIRTLNSIPVLAVAAPGVGKAIQVISGSVNFTANAVAFTSATLNLRIDTLIQNQAGTADSILQNGINDFHSMQLQTPANNMITNNALNIIANADSAVGDGTAVVYGAYQIITL